MSRDRTLVRAGSSLLGWPNRKPHHAFGGVSLRMRPRLSRPLKRRCCERPKIA
jgi:hypothetical protein